MKIFKNIDCLKLFKTIENDSIDLAILDPPYNVNAADWDNIDNYLSWMKDILLETERVLKDNGSLYLWGMNKNNDFLKLKLWMDDTLGLDFKNWIVWIHEVKIHRKLKDRYLTKHEDLLFYGGKDNTFNVVRDNPPDFQLKMHTLKDGTPTYDENYFIPNDKLRFESQRILFKNGLQLGSPAKSWWKGPSNQSASKKYKKFAGYKSEWVCDRIVKVSSNENDVVLIPFAGTGTEILAAKGLNRRYIASEINKDRFELSVERLKTLDYPVDKFIKKIEKKA